MINTMKLNNFHRKEVFNQVTKCGDIYINDESTNAFVLCSFCKSDSDEQILRSIDTFIDHIKWHRSESEEPPVFTTVEIDNEMPTPPDGDPIDLKVDTKSEYMNYLELEDLFSLFPENCLRDIIDIYKKCPCLWHSATANAEKQFIDPARLMITKFFNKLTNKTESVGYVTKILKKIKQGFLELVGEIDMLSEHIQRLNFLLTSEMDCLDESIYTDFACTICTQKLESWEFLWYHLCECHMEIENDDLESIGFSDDEENESETKFGDDENKPGDDANFITEFIETHKSLSILWDKSHPQYNNRRRRNESYNILRDVMKKYNQTGVTNRSARLKVRQLRNQFVYAWQKLKEAEIKKNVYTPHIWYYDKLLYLEHTIQDKNSKLVTFSLKEFEEVNTNLDMCKTCIICKKEFADTVACIDHMQCSHDSKAFQSAYGSLYCPICNHKNKTKASFIRHLRHAHESHLKECDECGKQCRSMNELVRHKAKVHKDFFPFKCPECGKGHSNINRMKTHAISHWDVNDRPHVCQVCGAKFSNRANFTVHVRRHTKDYKNECHICGHKCATTPELRSHILTHTKNYQCICEVCGKAFRNKTVLRRHVHEVHENKTYICKFCGMEIKRTKALQQHYKWHRMGMVDQECEICGKTFSRDDYLKKHMRRQHRILSSADK